VRPRVVLVTCLAALLGVAGLTIPTTRAALASLGARSQAVAEFSDPPPAPPAPPTAQVLAQPAPPAPTLRAPADPGAIRAPGGPSFFSWAFLDRKSGAVVGSANSGSGTNTVESMVKAWIASDFLRMQASAGRTPDAGTLNDLTLMIIDSNDGMAEKYYEKDGTNAVIQRLISMCGLTRTTIYPYYWSRTTMTPQDAVRYGNCVANGTAAGPKWTDWILDTMRHVRGGVNDQISTAKQGGRWGIIDGLPPEIAAGTSIKNGFTGWVDGWHVNCLAIQRDWVLNVMVRIGSLPSAANVCRSVSQQLVVAPDL
jgi:hypothetical protein